MTDAVLVLSAGAAMLTAPVVLVTFLKRFVLTPGRREWSARAVAWGGEFHPEAPGFYGHVRWESSAGRLVLAEVPGLRGWETVLSLHVPRPCDGGLDLCARDAALAEFRLRWAIAGAALVAFRTGCTLTLPGSLARRTQADELLRDARSLLERVAGVAGKGSPA